MPRHAGIVHEETNKKRLADIERLILQAEDEIACLRLESQKLQNGETSLRSLGLYRVVLYPLWQRGLRTVEDVQRHIVKNGDLGHLPGLGPKGKEAIMSAMATFSEKQP